MKKIRLSDTDLELFDLEINPSEFIFFSRHKEAFRCMWKEQGETFWKKFTITFRSFTNRHGVIKEISNNSPKFEDFVDQAFIFIHENFVEGREGKAKNFIEDIAKLAQNRERFRDLDSKSFAKDPFYMRDTRDLFRRFFGPPDQKSSYLKVYVVSPIYLRFGGSVCRCLRRWLDAPTLDDGDESYWVPPEILINGKENNRSIVIMCERCLGDCSTKYFREKLNGKKSGPSFISYWPLGDPRFNDEENPLYAPYMDELSDWRETLSADQFRDFLHYAKFKYGSESDKCQECLTLSSKKGDPMDSITVAECKSEGQKKKKKRKKKNKAKPMASNEPDEIDDLVAHIQGERELIRMPVSTLAGARLPDVVIPIQPREEKWRNKPSDSKKNAFADKINVIEDFKSGILQATDDIPTNSRIGGFDVVRIKDEITGASELTISVKALEGEEGRPPRPRVVKSQNSFPLSAKVIRSHLVNLPEKTEWYEGDGWCACVLNYSEEEKENPTHFAIKVSGPDEDTSKRTMLKLLFYVSRRKNRPCPGWSMDDDDVVACILPDDCPHQEGLTISIIKGFSFEERLTEEEISSMNKDEDIIASQTGKILVTIRGENVKQLIQNEQGKKLFKRLLHSFGRDAVNGSTGESLDLTRPFKDEDGQEYEQPIWNQIKQEPEKFEIFFKVPNEHETELNKLGFQTIDRAFFDKDPMNKVMPWERVFCLRCKRNRRVCTCGPFRKFIELDYVGKKPCPLSAGEDMDLKIGANDKKPAFEEILSKEFENHALLREKQQQRLNDMKTKMKSVQEVDEEIVREEIIDSLKNVFGGEKFHSNLNPDFVENVNLEKNLEVSHEDDKDDTFREDNDEKENTDKVIEAQLMTDAKEDEVGREEDLPVSVNDKRELGNLRNVEEKGKENDQVLKMDIGEIANGNLTVEEVDEEIEREETTDYLKDIFSRKKFCSKLSPDLKQIMVNAISEKNLEVSHGDDKEDTFRKANDERESTDEVNEAQLMTDAKEDEVGREEDLPVSVNENRDLGNLRNVEEKGKENDQVSKMDIGENANASLTEEEVLQNEGTMDDKDGEVLENLENTESAEMERTKLERDNSSVDEEEHSMSKMSENTIKDLVDEPEIEKLMAEVSLTNMKEQLDTSSENKTNGIEEDYKTPEELKNAMQQIIDTFMETSKDPVVFDSDSSPLQETLLNKVDQNRRLEENLKESSIIKNGDMEQEHDDVKTSEQKLGQRISSKEVLPDCIERTKEKEVDSSSVERVEERKEKPTRNLRRCSFCKTEEPASKTYKKCLKCKQEGIISARYYCGKNCQTADWKLRHKDEHRRNLLD